MAAAAARKHKVVESKLLASSEKCSTPPAFCHSSSNSLAASVPIGVPPRVPRAPSMAWAGMLLGTVEKASASGTNSLVASNLPVRTSEAPIFA